MNMEAIESSINWLLKASLTFCISVTVQATAKLLTYLWSSGHALQGGVIGFYFDIV